jgi:hypothetical protein
VYTIVIGLLTTGACVAVQSAAAVMVVKALLGLERHWVGRLGRSPGAGSDGAHPGRLVPRAGRFMGMGVLAVR